MSEAALNTEFVIELDEGEPSILLGPEQDISLRIVAKTREKHKKIPRLIIYITITVFLCV